MENMKTNQEKITSQDINRVSKRWIMASQITWNSILTGGQCGNAWNGRELLKELYEKGAGRIEILAAGGINAEVIEKLIPLTGISSYHMSGKILVESGMTYRKAGVSMGLPEREEYALWQTSKEKVMQAVKVLKNVQNE
ncbi:copper homeostasis protein CutC [Lachnospiraceae bacterium 54-53]